MMDTVILIPAYNPDNELINTVKSLYDKGFSVLVVNDGSSSKFDEVFKSASEYAEIIGYSKNKGKGSALKYGISYISENIPDCRYFITADADGQHSTDDIVRVAASIKLNGGIVLGVREFQGKVPLRSRVGNSLSRFAYTIASGKYLPDNQCGLRGFETSLAKWLVSIGGSKYDYEINVLMRAAIDNIKITELTINTIYISGNKSSHFRPLEDTLLIHKRIWSAAWVSLLTFFLSIALVWVLYDFFKNNVNAPELTLLSTGGITLIIGCALIVSFAPIIQLHLFGKICTYLLRYTAFFVCAFIITEIIYIISNFTLHGAYVVSEIITSALSYVFLRFARYVSVSLKSIKNKEASNETIC